MAPVLYGLRDKRIISYLRAINDGNTGILRDLARGVNATLYGGSTLTGQAKFRNDFQQIPGTDILAFRATPAWSNLIASLPAGIQNASFELNESVGDYQPSWATLSRSTNWASHGNASISVAPTSPGMTIGRAVLDVTPITSAGITYTACAICHITEGTARLELQDDVSGVSYGNWPSTPGVYLLFVTKTFDANSTQRLLSLYTTQYQYVPAYFDSIILVSGSSLPMFEEASNTVSYATIPRPWTPGEDISLLVFVWGPWAFADNRIHPIFAYENNSWVNQTAIYKYSNNSLVFAYGDSAGNTRSLVWASPPWDDQDLNVIAGSISGAGQATINLAINGTACTISATGTGIWANCAPPQLGIGQYVYYTGDYSNSLIAGPYFSRGAWSVEECARYSNLRALPPLHRRIW